MGIGLIVVNLGDVMVVSRVQKVAAKDPDRAFGWLGDMLSISRPAQSGVVSANHAIS